MMAPIPHMKPRLVQSFRRLGAHLWPPCCLGASRPSPERRGNGGSERSGREAEFSGAAASSSQIVPLHSESPIVLHVHVITSGKSWEIGTSFS